MVSESPVLLALPMRETCIALRTSGAVFLRCALHDRFRVQLGTSLSTRLFEFDFIRFVFFGFIFFSSEIFRASGSANAEVVFALYKKVGE